MSLAPVAEGSTPVRENGKAVNGTVGSQSVTQKSGRTKKKRKAFRNSVSRRGRGSQRTFPPSSFQETMVLAEIIVKSGAVNRMRRLTVFDELKKSPDSGASRMLVINSSKYGLTVGGYQADYLEVTPNGRIAVDPDVDSRTQLSARFVLAISGIPPFDFLYEKLAGNKLPAQSVIYDLLREANIPEPQISECADIFIVNLKFLGLLKTVAGAERILKLDHALDEIPSTIGMPITVATSDATPTAHATGSVDWNRICFYITPIGAPDSDERRHSDLFLNNLVEPALKDTGLRVVRADQIGKAGMIGAQVIEHVIRARLVIVDLSFHNPNVFYELSLRHACGLPTVQIIQAKDQMPFDIQQFRTIPIDNTDIYSFVPKLEVYRSQIATQVREALADARVADNPILTFCPGLQVQLPPLQKLAPQQIV